MGQRKYLKISKIDGRHQTRDPTNAENIKENKYQIKYIYTLYNKNAENPEIK